MKYKFKINLVTLADCNDIVAKISANNKNAVLTDGNKYCVSAKSFLGAVLTMEWNQVFIESDDEIFSCIRKWVI